MVGSIEMFDDNGLEYELSIIDNSNFYELDKQSCVNVLKQFHERIKDFPVWKQLDDMDEFFVVTMLNKNYLDECEKKLQKSKECFFHYVFEIKNIDILYLTVLYRFDDINLVLNFFSYLSKQNFISDANKILCVILVRKYFSLIKREYNPPIDAENPDFLDDIKNLLKVLADNVFFTIFYPVLSNMWELNEYTSYCSKIREMFLNKVLKNNQPDIISIINNSEWDATKNSVYCKLVLCMNIDCNETINEYIWKEIVKFFDSEKYINTTISKNSDDSEFLLAISNFIALNDDYIDKFKSEIEKKYNIAIMDSYHEVNVDLIRKLCYLFSVGSYACQILFHNDQEDNAEKLYIFILDNFSELMQNAIPLGYDDIFAYNFVADAVKAVWLNMQFFTIDDAKIKYSFDCIKNFDNKLIAAKIYVKTARENISCELEKFISSTVSLAEKWFEKERQKNASLLKWRKSLISDIRGSLNNV